jgi:hypothetical protein
VCAKCPEDFIKLEKKTLTKQASDNERKSYESKSTQSSYIEINSHESKSTQCSNIEMKNCELKSTQTAAETTTYQNNESLEIGLVKILDQVSEVNKHLQKLDVPNDIQDLRKELEKQRECNTRSNVEKQFESRENREKSKNSQLIIELEKEKAKNSKLIIEMELEKAKEKSRYSKVLYESETEKVKLKSEIESNNVKLSCQEKSQNIFHTELNMMKKRFKQNVTK